MTSGTEIEFSGKESDRKIWSQCVSSDLGKTLTNLITCMLWGQFGSISINGVILMIT